MDQTHALLYANVFFVFFSQSLFSFLLTEPGTEQSAPGLSRTFKACVTSMDSLFRNVEKLKAPECNEGLVLSPVPLRSFRVQKRARDSLGKEVSPRESARRVKDVADRFVGTSTNLDEPHTSEGPTFVFQTDNVDMECGSTAADDWLSDEELLFPCLEWESLRKESGRNKKEKGNNTVEEEEQVCKELFAIFQARADASAQQTIERVSPKMLKRMESDEDLANAILNLSSPPPRVSNPITQNKCFGKGMCVLPVWEEDGTEEPNEDHHYNARIIRSCSAPTISL